MAEQRLCLQFAPSPLPIDLFHQELQDTSQYREYVGTAHVGDVHHILLLQAVAYSLPPS